jgi:hypothetical protein
LEIVGDDQESLAVALPALSKYSSLITYVCPPVSEIAPLFSTAPWFVQLLTSCWSSATV